MPLANHARGVAAYYIQRIDITSDNRTGTNDGGRTYGYTRQYKSPGADKGFLPDRDRRTLQGQFLRIGKVVCSRAKISLLSHHTTPAKLDRRQIVYLRPITYATFRMHGQMPRDMNACALVNKGLAKNIAAKKLQP